MGKKLSQIAFNDYGKPTKQERILGYCMTYSGRITTTKYRVAAWFILLMAVVLFQMPLARGSNQLEERTVEQTYPGLCTGGRGAKDGSKGAGIRLWQGRRDQSGAKYSSDPEPGPI